MGNCDSVIRINKQFGISKQLTCCHLPDQWCILDIILTRPYCHLLFLRHNLPHKKTRLIFDWRCCVKIFSVQSSVANYSHPDPLERPSYFWNILGIFMGWTTRLGYIQQRYYHSLRLKRAANPRHIFCTVFPLVTSQRSHLCHNCAAVTKNGRLKTRTDILEDIWNPLIKCLLRAWWDPWHPEETLANDTFQCVHHLYVAGVTLRGSLLFRHLAPPAKSSAGGLHTIYGYRITIYWLTAPVDF